MMYALMLSEDLSDIMIKHKKITSNLDTIFMLSFEYHYLEEVKEFLESMSRTSDLIKTITLDYSDKEVWDELFRLVELNENQNFNDLLNEALNTVPNDIICIEGIINYLNYDELSEIKEYHDKYFEFNELYNLREHFGYDVI